jgi:glycosyltransferase involved in cell wall biosynthesis
VGRLNSLGVREAVQLRGYVPLREGLLALYRSSHVFLHVSLTEGFPQVLIEAFASGVPVVATAVGGVPAEVGDAAILIPPEDASQAVEAVKRITTDRELRERLIAAGLEKAREHTMEHELQHVAGFLAP